MSVCWLACWLACVRESEERTRARTRDSSEVAPVRSLHERMKRPSCQAKLVFLGLFRTVSALAGATEPTRGGLFGMPHRRIIMVGPVPLRRKRLR